MKKYLIAGHVVGIDRLVSAPDLMSSYEYQGELAPEHVFSVTPDALQHAGEEWLDIYRAEIEEFLLSRQYCRWLAQRDGLYLHASAVARDGRAYVFTADSGTGKSTHAHLWKQAFGADRVEILNDDKPLLCERDDGFFVCGSPWCGKEHQQVNRMLPLQGICFLVQGEHSEITSVTPRDAVLPLLRQTLLPEAREEADALLSRLERLVERVPLYRLRCNISEDAARLAYETMRPRKEEQVK